MIDGAKFYHVICGRAYGPSLPGETLDQYKLPLSGLKLHKDQTG